MSPATTALISVTAISAGLIAAAQQMSRHTLGAAPAELTMDDLTGRPGDYRGQHRDERPQHWTPAHTKAAARRRATLQHVRPAGVRPDPRIEQTQALDLSRLGRMLDLGDILRMGKGGTR